MLPFTLMKQTNLVKKITKAMFNSGFNSNKSRNLYPLKHCDIYYRNNIKKPYVTFPDKQNYRPTRLLKAIKQNNKIIKNINYTVLFLAMNNPSKS